MSWWMVHNRRPPKKEFHNGRSYRQLRGQRIFLPRDLAAQPSREALEWHASAVFR